VLTKYKRRRQARLLAIALTARACNFPSIMSQSPDYTEEAVRHVLVREGRLVALKRYRALVNLVDF
jgi:hypothetical protein